MIDGSSLSGLLTCVALRSLNTIAGCSHRHSAVSTVSVDQFEPLPCCAHGKTLRFLKSASNKVEHHAGGENANLGAVTINDRVYEKLTGAMISVNAEAEDVHAVGAAS